MNPLIDPLLASLESQIASYPSLAGFNLLSLTRPSVGLATQRVPQAQVAVGQSRIGGVPDVPPDFEWPRWLSPEPKDEFTDPLRPEGPAPLGFIAQIDLSDIPRVDASLPASGWLYFFYDRYSEPWGYDPAHRGCCRILYVDSDRSTLKRAESPPDSHPEHVAQSCLIEAWPELTVPDNLPEVEYGTEAYEEYEELRETLLEGGGDACHRLLGHPQQIQNAMELECQLASNGVYCGSSEGHRSQRAKGLEAGAADWRLLLQIDSDENGPGWMWGDVGRIYFWVKQQDLQALRFDDAWLIFQCY